MFKRSVFRLIGLGWVAIGISVTAQAAPVIVNKPAELSSYCARMAQRAYDQVLTDHKKYLATKPASVPTQNDAAIQHQQSYARQEVTKKCQEIVSRSSFSIEKRLIEFCAELPLESQVYPMRPVPAYQNPLECLGGLQYGTVSDKSFRACTVPANTPRIQLDCLKREKEFISYSGSAGSCADLEACEAKVKRLEMELRRLRGGAPQEEPSAPSTSGRPR